MNEEEEKTRRTDIIAAMHLIPLHVDFNEGCAMLRILYDIGWLRQYLRESRRRNRKQDPESRSERLDCECIDHGFTFQDNVQTDSIGRITSLEVPSSVNRDDENENRFPYGYYDLPPSISLLRHLQYIYMEGLQRIPLELGNLPCLTDIVFREFCDPELFDRIPDGCQLSVAKRVSCHCPPSSISSFLSLLPRGLEELNFNCGQTSNAIISAFQNEELRFHQSLTKLDLAYNKVNNGGFESLLFKIVPRFPSLRDLRLGCNEIASLNGIEKQIRDVGPISETKLVKLDLSYNPVIDRETHNFLSSEKLAALVLLKQFDTISNLCALVDANKRYDPDIECVLRNNLMRRSFSDEGISGTWPRNPALWPLMLEKVYKISWKVYGAIDDTNPYVAHVEKERGECSPYVEEYKKKKRCATELFHMVRDGPIFAVDQSEIEQDTSTLEDDTTTT